MAYTAINDPTKHFNTNLYTGNGLGAHAVVGVGFQPDLIWVQAKNNAGGYFSAAQDTSRGIDKVLAPVSSAAEVDTSAQVLSVQSDGFTVGDNSDTGNYVNLNTYNYVAWNWLANGGTRTTNTESGNNPAGGYQANTTAGFSIVDYTGTGAAGTMAHGLGAVPHLMIVRNREIVGSWLVYHHKNTSAPETDILELQADNATYDNVAYWNDTAPTSSVFTINTSNDANKDADGIIAYVWTEIQGYSKFGSYTGNGNADGPFIYTGFKPAWLVLKPSSAVSSWFQLDTARDPVNPANKYLQLNSTAVEASASGAKDVDLLSNGFKGRAATGWFNDAGVSYVYMAFAESPFVTSNGAPGNAK